MIHYHEAYPFKDLTEEIIKKWKNGVQEFTLYSSGTTGTSKPITLKRDMLKWSVNNTVRTFGLQDENCFCCLPLDKTGGFMMLIRALDQNWNIHLETPSTSPLDDLPTDHHYTLCSLSPQQCTHALENTPQQLATFSTILIGGASISPELESKLLEFSSENNTRFFISYGMTETASHIAYRIPGQDHYQSLKGVVLSEKIGCLNISIPELDLDIQTNDRVELLNDGFRVLGRADHVINSGGIKIFPEETEPLIKEVLTGMGINRNFFITSEEDELLGQRCILVVQGPPITNDAFILEVLKRELPKYHAPKRMVFQNTFHYTTTGKLIRSIDQNP